MQILDTSTLESLSSSPHAQLALSILSFSESSFFVIPPELLLIPMALATPSSALYLGFLTTITSVLGSLFGYWIGDKGGKAILKKFFSGESIEKVKILFHKYDAWAILITSFTPIPFKLSTIAAGTFDLSLKRFIVASTIGRGGRYMLIAALLYLYGEPIKTFITEDLGVFLLSATIIAILLYGLKKYFSKLMEKRVLKISLFDRILSWLPKKSN